MGKWLPIPFLAAPFILTFWVLWFFADTRPELVKLDLGPWPVEDVRWGTAAVGCVGLHIVCPVVITGVLFFVGVLVSNWRHAVIALLAALIAVSIAAHVGVAGGAVNTGFCRIQRRLWLHLGAAAVLQGDLRLARSPGSHVGHVVLQLHQPQCADARAGLRFSCSRSGPPCCWIGCTDDSGHRKTETDEAVT